MTNEKMIAYLISELNTLHRLWEANFEEDYNLNSQHLQNVVARIEVIETILLDCYNIEVKTIRQEMSEMV